MPRSLGDEKTIRIRFVGIPGLPGNRRCQIPMESRSTLRAVFDRMAELLDVSSIANDQGGQFLIMVNSTPISRLDGWDTEVSPGDDIVVLLPFSGGESDQVSNQ